MVGQWRDAARASHDARHAAVREISASICRNILYKVTLVIICAKKSAENIDIEANITAKLAF